MRIARLSIGIPGVLLAVRASVVLAQPACGQCEPAFGQALPVSCGSVRAMSGGVGEPPVRFDVRSGDAVFHGTDFPVLVQGCRSATPGSQFGCEKVFDLSLNLTAQELAGLAQGNTESLTCADGLTSITYAEEDQLWFATDCAIEVAGVPPTTQIRGTFTGTLTGPSTIDVTGCFCSESGDPPDQDPCEALAIDKTDNGQGWGKDPLIKYVVAVTGDGNPDLVLTETVPVQSTFDAAASTAGWACTPGPQEDSTCTLAVNGLAAGERREVTFAVRVKDGTNPLFDIYNRAVVSPAASATPRSHESAEERAAEACTDQGEVTEELCFTTLRPPIEACCMAAMIQIIQCLGVFTPTTLPLTARAEGATRDPHESALLLYRVRDRVFHQTPGGRRATQLFYLHSPDMVLAATANPELIAVARAGLDAWWPHLEALATGHGGEVTVAAAHIAALDAFLDALRPLASPALRQALDRERTLLDPASLAGLTASQALARLDALSCTPGPDLASVRCRIGELTALVQAFVPDGKLERRLLASLQKAGKKAEAAQRLTDQGNTRPARNALRKVSKGVTAFEKRLGSRPGLRDVPADARDLMLGTSGPLRIDVETLRGG